MTDENFDAIVVGAGMAGIACAGELVLQGAKPLLISETTEVGSTYRPKFVGNNRGVMQVPIWQVTWGGGWWFPLVRALNVPVRLHASLPITVTIKGTGKFVDVPICPSASALTDLIVEMSPLPLAEIREPFEKLLQAALAIPYQDLLKLDRTPLAEWLKNEGADELVAELIVMLLTNLQGIPREKRANELSAFGGLGTLRTVVCGEAIMVNVEPDPRDGLCVPICNEVERRGGSVWRGRRVERVLIEADKAVGVVLEDGTEVRAPVVAIAAGNPRIPFLLPQLPPEAEEPLAYSARFTSDEDFALYTVLDKPVVERDRLMCMINTDGTNLQWSWPLHPHRWTTEPGKQFVASFRNYPSRHVADLGGADAIYGAMRATNEELWPGFEEAVEDSGTQQHRHHWSLPLLAGPKLPRRVDSIPGLWFVGDGTAPIGGIWTEGATSAGILGAQAIAAARKV